MTTTTTFVPGNKVKLLDNTGYEDSMTVGEIYTVASVHYSSIYGDAGLLKVEGSPQRLFARRFELAPANKFKEGDKVVCVTDNRYYITQGLVYEVVRDGENDGYVRIYDNDGDVARYREDEFELYVVPAKFKVGQKVRLTEDAYGNGFDHTSVGQIVTISEVKAGAYIRGDYGYRIEEHAAHGNRLYGTYEGWNGENSFEEVAEEPEAKEAKVFEVGDKVRTLLYYNGVAKGTEAEITEIKVGTFGSVFYRVAGVIFTADELELVEEPVIVLGDMFDFAAMEQFIAEQFVAEQEVQDEFHVEHFGGQTVIRMQGNFDALKVAAILQAAYA